jgi:hypothetical protein
VILGWKMAPAMAETVREFARDLNKETTVLEARLLRGQVRVDTD